MTYALVMIRGSSDKRDETLAFLNELKSKPDHERPIGASLEHVFISFGWPDFIVMLHAANVELLKEAIINLRKAVWDELKDAIETSTVICSTYQEIEDRKKEWREKIRLKI